MQTPKLTLVGAGPGDETLITLKGIHALEAADVILYDALANPALLKYCREDALKIFVGKRAGQHHLQQHQINRAVVRYARKYGQVVRLKGGDPFVFGRGQEEKEYALKYGLEVEVVPGISSALAVPALQHIPLTHRGINDSFWVMTGTTRAGALSADMALAAQSSATIVILMGMKQLEKIVKLFSKQRGTKESIAIIQDGTSAHEKVAVGKLEDILDKVAHQQITSPAIIVIGAVVEKHWEIVQERVSSLRT
ncbi:uroporphyrinogen-III C-methyltransferase [Catalinimonas niigatensis]|uniref:uroporphyrinogen-III C-methyltransferase n=1 Tax=Catalinimonas niigatensis TaxID=1397264 RepID=UPI00266655F3|nr:uroporphyrinogen-III C-methyltransferase [Catalinimonas niigatensis]WPP49003.1 uroporphyrinogen-III C-methyltransferase [Catalinimonas niigatensis]